MNNDTALLRTLWFAGLATITLMALGCSDKPTPKLETPHADTATATDPAPHADTDSESSSTTAVSPTPKPASHQAVTQAPTRVGKHNSTPRSHGLMRVATPAPEPSQHAQPIATPSRANAHLDARRLGDFRKQIDAREAMLAEVIQARAELHQSLEATAGTLSMLHGYDRDVADRLAEDLRTDLQVVDTSITALRQELARARQGLQQLSGE